MAGSGAPPIQLQQITVRILIAGVTASRAAPRAAQP